MDKFFVVGNPISHSLSPDIHTLFSQQTQRPLSYQHQEIALGQLSNGLAQLCQLGARGFNITVPFKTDACDLCVELSDRAKLTGSVNTISVTEDNTYIGDTTDGRGLVNDLINNHQLTLANSRILLLGAGGAAAGVLPDLLALPTSHIHIANRTVSRADILCEQFSHLGSLQASDLDNIPKHSFDLIINATAATLNQQSLNLPTEIISKQSIAYDMMYGKTATPFMQWAKAQQAALCIDGLGMLVEQAAIAFAIWHDVMPETAAVIHKIRASLQ